MSRRRESIKRQVIPDAKYKDKMVAKFTNVLMLQGKKSTAENIVYGAFDIIEGRHKQPALETFRKALDMVKPKVEVRAAVLVVPPTRCPWRSVTIVAPASQCVGSCSSRASEARSR